MLNTPDSLHHVQIAWQSPVERGMIRVTVQQLREGAEGSAAELGRAELRILSGGSSAIFADYSIEATEGEYPESGLRAWSARGMIGRHDRRQSIWALVSRASRWAADQAERLE